MGAYENPPLITQPNYGEIFARNAQNIIAIAKEREEEKEAKFLQAAERKTEYSRKATNIKAGALTENVTQVGLGLTDKYFLNEDAFAKGDIDAEQYSINKAKYESTLNALASAGNTIRQFDEALKGLDLSSYQSNPEVFGLIEAYKQGKIDVGIIGGKLELKYEDPDGNTREVDEKWLSNTNSWSVVEKFDSDTVTNSLADIVKKQITEQASTTIQTDDAKVTTTEQRYSAAYGTREQRIEQLYNNSIIQGLDQDELGSYYMDKIVPNISVDVTNELTNILNSENYKDISEEQKKQIQADVNAGQWSNREFKIGDKTVNSSSILSELSKRQLVKEALNKVPQPKVSTATVLDQRTPAPEKPGKDPIEQRTGFDKQERANAVNKILALEPGETFEIKFQGTNDFKKENYEMIKNPDGTISYRIKPKKGEEGTDYLDISAGDLYKEFGVEDLTNEQPSPVDAKSLIEKYSTK